MPVTVLVGAQWGDEGKGKAADWLAEDAHIIARYNGGDNAGHTLNVHDITYKLHFIPSGVLRPGVMSIMGGAMVIHPERLLHEVEELRAKGVEVTPQRLRLASNAHIITPSHQALDAAREAARGQSKLGTTGRGIGPAYTSKAAREGIRAGLMRNPEAFGQAVWSLVEEVNQLLVGVYDIDPLDPQDVAKRYRHAAEQLAPYLVDVSAYINKALKAGQRILAEGGQATLLDLDHGNYPYVTSSNATVGGAIVGLGFGPTHIDRVVGVSKAFCTRVGSGPFPTEQDNEIGALMRGDGSNPWDDYGTTTGRPRRCGWLDMVALKYAVEVNGMTELALMKLDILGRFEEIKVATAYEIDGQRVEDFPIELHQLERAQPIYETLPGWKSDVMSLVSYSTLPAPARAYVEWIEARLGIPISLVSVGPGREQTFLRGHSA
jgi:adenylosuccinate synthase